MVKVKGNQRLKLSRRPQCLGVVLILFLLLTVAPAIAQSCALCYTQAASAGARMVAALRNGILILVIPPTLGSIGMIFVVHRKRNQVRHRESNDEPSQDW